MGVPPEAFVAVAGADSSMEFRKVVSAFLRAEQSSREAFERSLRAALALSEPTRAQAVTNVVADVLESHTTDEGAELFAVVEGAAAEITAVTRADTRLGGLLLKSLLQVFREAGPARHASFRGRVLQFVNTMLPPLLPNSLNREALIAPASHAAAGAGEPAGEAAGELAAELDGGQHLKLDYNLYATFWRMQQSVSSGTLALTRPALFDTMLGACEAVLAAAQACLAASSKVGAKGRPAADDAASAPLAYFRDPEVLLTHFSPEFDARGSFKFQVLVQMLFYVSYLERQSKIERQVAALQDLSKRLLAELRVFGANAVLQLQQLLASDAQWHAWRLENVKLEALPAAVAGARVPGPDEAEAWRGVFASPAAGGMGNAELTRLWGLGAAGQEPQVAEPSFLEFVERVLEEADPANDIEPEYQSRQKASFQWKMLRSGAGELGALVHSASNSSNLFRKDVLTISRVLKGMPVEGLGSSASGALLSSQGGDEPAAAAGSGEAGGENKRAREEEDGRAAADEDVETKRARPEPEEEVMQL